MASPFWQYFHDKLNWPAIFRPGPVSALVKGLALYMDDVREDILWLRHQWNPATADDELIAAYGASRGILRTRYDTDESYRLRVVNAFAWHKLGGKPSTKQAPWATGPVRWAYMMKLCTGAR